MRVKSVELGVTGIGLAALAVVELVGKVMVDVGGVKGVKEATENCGVEEMVWLVEEVVGLVEEVVGLVIEVAVPERRGVEETAGLLSETAAHSCPLSSLLGKASVLR